MIAQNMNELHDFLIAGGTVIRYHKAEFQGISEETAHDSGKNILPHIFCADAVPGPAKSFDLWRQHDGHGDAGPVQPGRHGGVSLCNQVQFLLQMLVVGAGEGAVVLGAQYWGKGGLAPIPHIIGVALRFGGTLAAALFMVVLWAPERLLSLLSNEPAVIAQGVRYFQIICFTYVIFTLTNILVASLRSIGIVKIGYVISFSTLCINVFLNYCLIYGHFGRRSWGSGARPSPRWCPGAWSLGLCSIT